MFLLFVVYGFGFLAVFWCLDLCCCVGCPCFASGWVDFGLLVRFGCFDCCLWICFVSLRAVVCVQWVGFGLISGLVCLVICLFVRLVCLLICWDVFVCDGVMLCWVLH